MWLDGEQWARYFAEFEQLAFRLETHAQYLVADEAEDFAHFKRTGEPPPSGYNAAWHGTIRANRSAGRLMKRVHVITPPLSDYLRFQFLWGYAGNAGAGEEIRILDRSRASDEGLPTFDFWLFDDTSVVEMLYGPDGSQIGRRLLSDADPAEYVGYRELAWSRAVPFDEYWPMVGP